MITETTNLGRFGARNGPDSSFLSKALAKLVSLLRVDQRTLIAQKTLIWAASALKTARIHSFCAKALAKLGSLQDRKEREEQKSCIPEVASLACTRQNAFPQRVRDTGQALRGSGWQ